MWILGSDRELNPADSGFAGSDSAGSVRAEWDRVHSIAPVTFQLYAKNQYIKSRRFGSRRIARFTIACTIVHKRVELSPRKET